MIDVHVTIGGILLYCDESVTNINLGNGYTIRKTDLDNLPFKNRIIDGNGRLTINYLGSRLYDSSGVVSFMCLYKDEVYQIQPPQAGPSSHLTDSDLMCSDKLDDYKDKETEYLNKVFSLLRLYKHGNIGPKEIFFEHRFNVMGFINNTHFQTSDNVTRNIANPVVYSLDETEISECNEFLSRISNPEFSVLSNCIHEFVWGCEQVDIPTGFEQYTTTLEMILLEKDQKCKKEVLSKRIAALLENDSDKIINLYNKMKRYYRYRSDSLHEGNGDNITSVELVELEGIVRSVIKKYLVFCKDSIRNSPLTTWEEIKAGRILEMKNIVSALVASNVLPA